MKNKLDKKLIRALAPGGIYKFVIQDDICGQSHEIMLLGENWIKEKEIQTLIKKYMSIRHISSIYKEDEEIWHEPKRLLFPKVQALGR